ncbi:hypothetical protein ABE42_35075 [Bacillus thuringiensis]|uniref:Uncharacterized protein n=1 Tax=Bacillus thuringiensis TaxID=1428 RepID=A0A437SQL9_BACTU|nr:DUF6572 domain-containing protein [Bacillus thuringiensis]MBG9538284.1 hypothetical protein [Bacillus thuringiensis]MBG9584293.1 hypothetical protein [Bacillus thuringiensis]NIA60897.1 hypothetical protein [Bacillus pacificus]RVU65594.1 hypothetical protein BM74_02980 [Bacillus thuringiensis]
MSLRELEQIDLLAVEKETGYVHLIIADEEDWSDEEEHVSLLIEKIYAYLGVIESGAIYEMYPDAKGRQFVISIHGKYRCTEYGEEFFEKTEEIVMKAGYGFQYIHKPHEEGNTLAE